jgi:hypothetical protein
MLIALFAILFLGGSETGMLNYIADSQDAVKAVMNKDDRRKDALVTVLTT